MSEVFKQLPQYQSHKKVRALKIKAVDINDFGTGVLVFEDAGYSPRAMPNEYMTKHAPKAGGYFVVYDDGYESFSPAKAFEDGYTLIA